MHLRGICAGLAQNLRLFRCMELGIMLGVLLVGFAAGGLGCWWVLLLAGLAAGALGCWWDLLLAAGGFSISLHSILS